MNYQKKIDRKKYKANKNVPEEEIYQVEPKNILALSIFINLLNKEGITEIEVPGLYVLDYEYHEKRNEKMLSDFKVEWTEEKIKKYPDVYKRALYYFESSYKKEDLISQIKSERMLLTFRRLLYHYKKGNIKSYPGDIDSFMHLEVPIIKNKDDINGEIFKELYELQNQQIDNEIEI